MTETKEATASAAMKMERAPGRALAGKIATSDLAVAVSVDGERDILGIWAGDGGEGAKNWLHVLTEM